MQLQDVKLLSDPVALGSFSHVVELNSDFLAVSVFKGLDEVFQLPVLGSAQNGSNASNAAPGANTSGATAGAKDRSRDLSTAKTAQSTPHNANPNANRTIGHYVVGK